MIVTALVAASAASVQSFLAASSPCVLASLSVDLMAALKQYDYDLNERELALVLRFRDALEEAGIDLFLTERLTDAEKALLQQVLD